LNTETGIRSRSKRAATGNNTRYADYYVCENTKRRKRFPRGSSSVDVQEIQDKSQSAVNAAVADSGPDLHNIDESVPATNIDSVIESHHTTQPVPSVATAGTVPESHLSSELESRGPTVSASNGEPAELVQSTVADSVPEVHPMSQSTMEDAAVTDSGPDSHNIDESVPDTNIDSVTEAHHTTQPVPSGAAAGTVPESHLSSELESRGPTLSTVSTINGEPVELVQSTVADSIPEVHPMSQSAVEDAAVTDSGPDSQKTDESIPDTNIDSVTESHHTTQPVSSVAAAGTVPESHLSSELESHGPTVSADALESGQNKELCENINGVIVPDASHNVHALTSLLCHINFDADGNVIAIVPYQSSSDPDPAFTLNDLQGPNISQTSSLNISLTSSLNSFIDSACIDDDLDFEPSVVDTGDKEPEPVVADDHHGSNSDLPQPSTSSMHKPDGVELSGKNVSPSDVVLEHEVLPGRRKIAKKGTADPSKWKRNANALRRMHGEGRQPGNSCCNCCDGKFNAESRNKLFQDFWAVDWNRKRDFVLSNTEVMGIARKTAGEASRRKSTIHYYLPTEQSRIKVCKNFFLSTLGVGTMFVRWTLKNAASTFAPVHGHTGKSPANKTPSAVRQHTVNFLKRFPTMPSHYCRRDTNLMYLEPGLTIPKLYQLYKQEVDNEKKRGVSMKIFREVFRELNLGFFNPRKDQCDTCIGHKEGHISQAVYDSHIEDKERARHFKNVDKVLASESDGKLRVLTMDLQQLLMCPKSFSSATYYKRKLSVHNFTMYDLHSREGYCYVWHEGEGGLDSDEFSTIIVSHLRSLPNTVESVILWSDGCSYQNRNAQLASAFMTLMQSNDKPSLLEVHQKYLTKGHTQMEVDSVHAAIETASAKIEVETPQEWVTVMKAARAKQPYHVDAVNHTFWKKYPQVVSSLRPGKCKGDPVVTDLKHVMYTKDGIFYSLTHGSPLLPLPTRPVRGRPVGSVDSVRNKYAKKLALQSSKIADLKELCKTVIKTENHAFYESLF